MGAKTALLAFTDGDLRPALLGSTPSDSAEAEAVVREILPGYDVTLIGDSTLDGTYPPDDITHVTVLPGAELLCDRRLVLDRPSELPEHLLRAGAGRRIIMHGMHSVVDWLCFAVWEDGKLVRSLSLSPDGGIEENIGEPFDFERPYWEGLHPVEPDPAWEEEDPSPLPFHPLELGEEALRVLFGFIIEGMPEPDDIDADSVHMHVFRVGDPSGQEQAAREAAYEQATRDMGPPRMFRMGPRRKNAGGQLGRVRKDSSAGCAVTSSILKLVTVKEDLVPRRLQHLGVEEIGFEVGEPFVEEAVVGAGGLPVHDRQSRSTSESSRWATHRISMSKNPSPSRSSPIVSASRARRGT